jgi:tetratricopeptide (TPR) repeat protein
MPKPPPKKAAAKKPSSKKPPAKNPARSKESPISKSTSPKISPATLQLANLEKAMKAFHKRDFESALPQFEEAAKGPEVSVSHTAALHARMCRQRMETHKPTLKTAEDNYAYGLTFINRREFAEAEPFLKKALSLSPKADHILYALALARGHQGDLEEAATLLSRAIEIAPNNRSAARNDPDFQELLRQSPLREIVHPEKSAGH